MSDNSRKFLNEFEETNSKNKYTKIDLEVLFGDDTLYNNCPICLEPLQASMDLPWLNQSINAF